MEGNHHKVKFILIVVLYVITKSYTQTTFNNFDVGLRDKCTLKNGKIGFCEADNACNYVKKLIKDKKFNEIVKCGGFIGRSQIVCCYESSFEKALCGKVNVNTSPNLDNKIISGERAQVQEFPFQVALGYKSLDGNVTFDCGGSIIANNIILTAAHCANKRDTLPVTVRLGRVSLTGFFHRNY